MTRTTRPVTKTYFELLDENEKLKQKLVQVLKEFEGLKNKTVIMSRKTGEGEHLDIERQGKDWIVKEPKVKGKRNSVVVPNINVQIVYDIIKLACDRKEKILYRELVPRIIAEHEHSEDVDVDSFSGGKWRRHERGYFQTYFYPVKILVHLGVVHHDKRGGVTRLK